MSELSDVDLEILEVFEEEGGAMKPSDVVEYVDSSASYVRQRMPKIALIGRLRKVVNEAGDETGEYALPGADQVRQDDSRYLTEVNSEPTEDDLDLDLQRVPEIEMGAGEDVDTDTINGNLVLPRRYIRSEYGVRPERLVIMRVRGRSMVDTLQPGQKVLAARQQQGQDLENDTIYGLRSTLGFSVKRLRFDWENEERVIWILSDNPEQTDQNHFLTRSEFVEEYDVVAKALEVGHKL
jgi:phage repressor protein C with HTH and peptisase S24 domain